MLKNSHTAVNIFI